ncbi:flavodoxin domain-containing protein [Sphingopyxis granuli]|uniref:flavodoxin domain-containing protein n=1 Tax=Sphingopyxis granuli TaxID=267128 RepID=UPI00301CB825
MSSNNHRAGIFIATMTGLAEMCAEEIEGALGGGGFACESRLMDGLGPDAFEPFDLIIIVSSTYGHGEIPDNGQALFEALSEGADLSGKSYAIFALGDRTYADTFCAAGDRWEEAMTNAGARRVVEIERHDASSGTLAEDVAGEWASGWISQLV